MLRRLTTLTFLTSTLFLTGCQSLYPFFHRADSTNINTSELTTDNSQVGAGFGSDSAIAYNQWQWNYFSKLSDELPNDYQPSAPAKSVSTNEFISEKLLRTSDGNIWDFSSENKLIKEQSWDSLSGANSKQCTSGINQSPIDITKAVVPLESVSRSYNLRYHYQPQNFSVQDNGHSVVFTAIDPTKSAISVQGKIYYLLNIQYRSISEHAIMGVHLPLELQLTHVAEDGKTVVVSIMVNTGAGNSQIQRLVDNFPATNEPDAVNTLTNFNVGKLIPNYGFYVYDGSITVPPCSENVKWLIATKALTADVEQIYKFEARHSGNMRNVQPQGNRTVYLIK